jgi:hypothetical protein
MNSDKEFVLPSLNRSIDRIEKAFPRYGSFLMEFIQNADDVGSSSLLIEIENKSVRIFNDGRVFSRDDVNSICRVGMSSKTSKDYIGYLGVGFKSVFLISDSPEIYSGEYRFKFDKNAWSEPEKVPWQVIPLWVETSISLSPPYKTLFRIPVVDENVIQKLQQETTSEYISNRMLLFLRNLKNIEIKNNLDGATRSIKKFLHNQTEDYEIYLIQEHLNGALKSQEYWLVFRSVCDVPPEVKKDKTSKDWERDQVEKREVVVAFRLDEKEKLVIEEKGTAHAGVFSFLPLKEVPSGLNFLIQADFLTTPGRSELARESLWNEWLAKEVYKLIIERCIPTFIENEKWQMNFVEILYSPRGGHPLFEDNIKAPLRAYLEKEACLVASDNSIIKTEEAVIIDSEIRKLMNEGDLQQLYPCKKPLHPEYKLPWDIERLVKKGPSFSANSGINDEMKRLLELKTKQKDLNFFKKFYLKLSEYSESTLRNSVLKYQEIILTDTWNLASPNIVYIKPTMFPIPNEIKDVFKIVHEDLSSDQIIANTLKLLGVEELTQEHVQNILRAKEIPNIRREWNSLSDEQKIEKIKSCYDLWKKRQVDVRDLGFLTLRTKSGKWLKPEEIFFSKEYCPDHQIEVLISKGLLDWPLELLSDVFLQDADDKEIAEWRRFFKELGVDKKLQDEKFRRNIISRIGIKTAIKFEEHKGRSARELTRSEETGGYDIIPSEDVEEVGSIESQERYIEVKSSAKINPDVFLTTRQFVTIQEKCEKYFVYIIRDALRNPTLCVTRGDKLLKITDVKTIIPFSKWWENAKEEEFQP